MTLTDEARVVHTPENRRAAVATLTASAPGLIPNAQVVEEGSVEAWPTQRPGDVAILYSASNGDSFSEAVTVTVV